MAGHRCRLVQEHTFHSGPLAPLLRQQQSYCRTHRRQLALGGLGCRHSSAAPKRYCNPPPPPPPPGPVPAPFPPAVPTPYCCCYTSPYPLGLRASNSLTRVRSSSLSASAAFAASRARWASCWACCSFPLSCKTFPSATTARCCHWGWACCYCGQSATWVAGGTAGTLGR